MKRRSVLGWLTASPILLSGCMAGETSGGAKLRLLNLQNDVETLTLRVDGSTIASGIGFESLSSYGNIDDDTLTTQAISDAGSVLISADVAYTKDTSTTLVIAGADSIVYNRNLTGDEDRPDAGYILVRTANLAARGQTVDVYITAPTATIAGSTPTFSAVSLGTVSSYIQLDQGSYRVRVTPNSSRTVIYDSGTFTPASRQVISLIFYTVGSASLLRCYALYGVDDDQSQTLPSTLARVKFVNATSLSDRLLLKLDGTTKFSSVPADGVSSYLTVDQGSHALSVQSDSAAAALIASADVTLTPGADYTVLVLGTASGAVLHLNQDNNLAPSSGYAKLRVVNGAADLVTVDFAVNYRNDFADIATGDTTDPLEYSPAKPSFSALFYDGASGSIDFSTLDVGLDDGLLTDTFYVAYLFGVVGSRRLSVLQNQ